MRSPWTIFVAMIFGLLVGLVAPEFGKSQAFIGDLFVKLLRMGVVPLIFINVIYAIVGLGDAKKLARIGGKTVCLFMITTFCAALLGCIMCSLIRPGVGFVYQDTAAAAQAVSDAQSATENSLSDFLLGMVPLNIIQALSEGNMLQTVIFAIASGIAILYLDKKHKDTLVLGFESISKWLMKILDGVLTVAPIGIFSLGCATMSNYGIDVIKPMAKFVATAYSAGIIQLLCVYPLLYFIITRKSPLHILKNLPPVWITAFSTRSTNAVLPVSLEISKEKVGVDPSVADFVIPLGASVNCDGAAIFLGIVVTFVSQSINQNLTFMNLVTMSLIGALVTLGNTGIPNAMFIMVPVILQTFNLPMEFMGLMGIYPIIDSISTTSNVTGDNVVAAIVDATEKRRQKREAKKGMVA